MQFKSVISSGRFSFRAHSVNKCLGLEYPITSNLKVNDVVVGCGGVGYFWKILRERMT